VSAETPIISLRQVSKSYGSVQALDDVDFDLYPAEVVALVGDNGAGKTTLVKVISGAHRPDRGEVFIDGRRCRMDDPTVARHMGIEVVYQNLSLLENLSISANVFLGREVRVALPGGRATPFMNFRAMNGRTRAMLENYNVVIDSPKRLVSKLSGGQRQLVAIARGAGWGSRVLVMDEPTAALGIQESAKVLELVRHLKDQGVSVLIVSHNLEHVFSVSDRIAVMRRARLVGSLRADVSNAADVVALITGAVEVDRTRAIREAEVQALALESEYGAEEVT
jgi:fructose transport system ATP-binding protein